MAVNCLGLFRVKFLWGILQILLLVIPSHQSTKDVLVFRIGDDLRLSCPSQLGSNQTWWFKSQSLDNNTIHTNQITILLIPNVSKKDEGIYWCGSSWQHGMNVTVLVGDLPSRPRNLYTTSYEFDKILHWTSASYTGGLQTHYSVHIHCTHMPNCSLMNTGALEVPLVLSGCDSVKHVDGKLLYQCSLKSVNLFVEYRATVYAVNVLGNSSASIVFCRPNHIYPNTTPASPFQLNATEVQQGKVKLTWKNQDSDSLITYFRVVYREEGTNNNKTWPKDMAGDDTTVVIDNLNADTNYIFYVLRQFRTKDLNSTFSTPAVTTLHTKYADPDQPPQDLRCSPITENLSNVSIVQVSWKPPSKKHRNGPLTLYKILYSTLGSFNKTIKTVNASQTSVNLTFAKTHETIKIFSKVCNKGGSCSGISNSCSVKGQPDSSAIKMTNPGNKIDAATIVGVVVAVVVCVLIIVLVIIYFSHRYYHRIKRADNINIEIDGPYAEEYEEPLNDGDDDEYHTPLV